MGCVSYKKDSGVFDRQPCRSAIQIIANDTVRHRLFDQYRGDGGEDERAISTTRLDAAVWEIDARLREHSAQGYQTEDSPSQKCH